MSRVCVVCVLVAVVNLWALFCFNFEIPVHLADSKLLFVHLPLVSVSVSVYVLETIQLFSADELLGIRFALFLFADATPQPPTATTLSLQCPLGRIKLIAVWFGFAFHRLSAIVVRFVISVAVNLISPPGISSPPSTTLTIVILDKKQQSLKY